MALQVLVLGAAAGGGLPQWNCSAPNCRSFWSADTLLAPATQSSLAVSADGEHWALLNASPDVRAQILTNPPIQPRDPAMYGLRNSPIVSVLLTNGDIDHIAGLLTLREGHSFDLYATPEILEVLDANTVFDALDRSRVVRKAVAFGTSFDLLPGLSAELFAVPGKVPLFMESGEDIQTDRLGEQTAGVRLQAGDRAVHYIPGCACVTPELADRLRGARTVLFDGTVFHDDEMIRAGVGAKTGRRMGHMPIAGPEGSLAAFADLSVTRKIYVHINNTNPIWHASSLERRIVEAAGWEVAHDGMEILP